MAMNEPASPPRPAEPLREATEFPAAAYQFDGGGNVTELPFTGGAVAAPDTGFVLIAGSLSSPDFKAWLHANLDPLAAEGMTAPDQHARCAVIDDRALVVLRIVRSKSDPEQLSKQTMCIWIEKNRVVIASKVALGELVSIAQWQKSAHAPLSPADLIARMGTRAADRLEPLVEKLGDMLDDIEDELMSRNKGEMRLALTRLRRALINLRRVVWPQRDVLNTLEIEDLSFLSQRDRTRLKEASARNARLGDELQILAERAALVHEQVLDTRAEQMNRTMLILAAVTVVFMPLTLLTGALGMNVSGIPFADNPHAFWTVCAALFLLSLGIVWWMRGRRWL